MAITGAGVAKAALFVVVLGGGGYLVYRHTQPTNLGEKLQRDGHSLFWVEENILELQRHDPNYDLRLMIEKYKKNPNGKPTISGLDVSVSDNSKDTENIKAYKRYCRGLYDTPLLEKNATESQISAFNTKYEEGKNWCTTTGVDASDLSSILPRI